MLGALLPATDNAEADLDIFEKLMAMDAAGFGRRIALSKSTKLKPATVAKALIAQGWTEGRLGEAFVATGGEALVSAAEAGRLRWARHVDWEQKAALYPAALATFAFEDWLDLADRAEQVDQQKLYAPVWPMVNAGLGTSASSIPELIEQLGIARFGKRPAVGDSFAGGGSIPFESARLGCDVVASDLNPIACMLTWGALNVVGGDDNAKSRIGAVQRQVVAQAEAEMAELGFEVNSRGDRAKSFLYCLEVRCPTTGYMVPLLPSMVLHKVRRIVVELVPNPTQKRFDTRVCENVTDDALRLAERGNVEGGDLIVTLNGETFRTALKTIRGDRRGSDGSSLNNLRKWTRDDFVPRPDDVFQERLYAIQWSARENLQDSRPRTYFSAPTPDDLRREDKVIEYVKAHLAEWQAEGLVPDTSIEAGAKTDEPVRTRGWTHWHHLFTPRQLLVASILNKHARAHPFLLPSMCKALDYGSKLCRWDAGHAGSSPQVMAVFTNQALNPLLNYGVKALAHSTNYFSEDVVRCELPEVSSTVTACSATAVPHKAEYWITDPPYADAVRYEEITEFFIAWLRKNPPEPFKDWVWDSRRALAIKGAGAEFKAEMIAAYRNLANHMPDNGLQIVMFTHQDAEVWADMAAIMWGAGLQVTAAWYVATETTSELKKGGYVQGTVLLVLRKRAGSKSGYADEIPLEIKEEVSRQIARLTGLNDAAVAHGRSENLFEDADLQMAGYAAALRVLTGYTMIDGEDMAAYAARPRVRGRKDVVEEMIRYAVDAANAELVPLGLPRTTWAELGAEERFYLKMVDLEAAGLRKLDNYQNFAKAFRAGDYARLMASVEPNVARLKTSVEFGKSQFEDDFGKSPTRAVLWAMLNLQGENANGKKVLDELRASVANYFDRRDELRAIARYLATQRDGAEGIAARTLAELIENERLG